MKPDLRITATDASTIFTGAANVHRFDAPTSREIAAYVRNVLGPDPGGAVVHLSAPPQRLRELSRSLADYDIQLVTEELLLDDASPHPAEDPDPPTDSWEAVPAAEPERGNAVWFVGAVVVVVALACAAALYATVFRQESAPVAADPPVEESLVEETSAEVGNEASPSSEAPQTVMLERDGLRVELPAGFALEEDDDMWRAVGEDPNFRLQIAVERRYQLPAQTMAEQLLADIDADPEIELVETDGHAVTYLERASDGSQALWKTWPDGADQVFIGCHTRTEPTNVQRATCRMAMESAEFQKSLETDGTEDAFSASNT